MSLSAWLARADSTHLGSIWGILEARQKEIYVFTRPRPTADKLRPLILAVEVTYLLKIYRLYLEVANIVVMPHQGSD